MQGVTAELPSKQVPAPTAGLKTLLLLHSSQGHHRAALCVPTPAAGQKHPSERQGTRRTRPRAAGPASPHSAAPAAASVSGGGAGRRRGPRPASIRSGAVLCVQP